LPVFGNRRRVADFCNTIDPSRHLAAKLRCNAAMEKRTIKRMHMVAELYPNVQNEPSDPFQTVIRTQLFALSLMLGKLW
jgi:hypothetical protein